MTDQLRDALRELLDGIHAGRFVPDGPGSQGYCGSLVEAGECALATPAPAQPDAAEIRGNVLEEAACICDGLTWAIDNAGQRYRREAYAGNCAHAIRERARAKPDPLHVANERGEGEPAAWVSVAERLPQEGETALLTCLAYWAPGQVRVGKYLDRGWQGSSAHWEPTHWMPLPAAPKEKP